MDITKLTPATKAYLWGGKKLKEQYGLGDTETVAEAWMLSFHPDGEGKTESGVPVSRAAGRETWGRACQSFPFFPAMVKLIDAADNLSVQVHPSDEYALQPEGQFGKTEMWYIVSAESGAGIYLGFERDVTPTEFADAIRAGNLLSLLRFVPVRQGDCYFIPAGTVHAIGKGCLIAEVQQNSNLTYRVFDYNRVGADGKPRELHVEKAMRVSNLCRYTPVAFANGVLGACPYFAARLLQGNASGKNDDSYTSLVVLQGSGTLCGKPTKAGDSWFVPAGVPYTLCGSDDLRVLLTDTPGR